MLLEVTGNTMAIVSSQGRTWAKSVLGWAFRQALQGSWRAASMGSVGDAYDNAMCESFFATLECELLDRRWFASQAEARMACFSFIDVVIPTLSKIDRLGCVKKAAFSFRSTRRRVDL